MEVAEKLAFFSETKHSFGRSALLLSGGASLGMYHFGVVKALHLNGLLPRVICGTSAGSIISSAICVRLDDELLEMWDPSFDWGERFDLHFFSGPSVRRFVSKRGESLYDSATLSASLRKNLGDFTFLEAFDRTGRICNIALSGAPGSTRYPMLLNYLTAPHVLVWSATVASCSLPGIFEPQELLAKDRHGSIVPYLTAGLKWLDGSMQGDLPITRLRELFNINFFIVSQVNPQARLFSGGGVRSPPTAIERVASFLRREVKQYMRSIADFANGVSRQWSPWHDLIGSVPVALVVQEYEGDVTIFNGGGLLELPNLLQNGTTEMIRRFSAEAEREAWWYIPQIQNACAIEFVMDEIIKDLRMELVAAGQGTGEAVRGMRQSSSRPSLIERMIPPDAGIGKVPSFYIDQQLSQVAEVPLGTQVQRLRPSTKGAFRPDDSLRLPQGLGKSRSVVCASNQSLVSLLAGATDCNLAE